MIHIINGFLTFAFCISIVGANVSKLESVIKEKEMERKTIEKVLPGSHLYAVIIAGSPEQHRHWNNVSAIYSALKSDYGYSDENIYVLYWDGTGYPRGSGDFDNDGVDDIDYAASKNNIEYVFSNILANEMGPDDYLFVFVTAHGYKPEEGGSDDVSILLPQGDRLYPHELVSFVAPINCKYMIFSFDQCYGGGFVRESDGSPADIVNGYSNRVALSASRWDEPW